MYRLWNFRRRSSTLPGKLLIGLSSELVLNKYHKTFCTIVKSSTGTIYLSEPVIAVQIRPRKFRNEINVSPFDMSRFKAPLYFINENIYCNVHLFKSFGGFKTTTSNEKCVLEVISHFGPCRHRTNVGT